MKVYKEVGIENFEAWSGAVDTKERIVEEGKAKEFDVLIEEQYPDGIDETSLNDLLWFEEKWIYEMLGISDEEDAEEQFESLIVECEDGSDYSIEDYIDGKYAIRCSSIKDAEVLNQIIMECSDKELHDVKERGDIHYWANGGVNVVKEEDFNKDIPIVDYSYWIEH